MTEPLTRAPVDWWKSEAVKAAVFDRVNDLIVAGHGAPAIARSLGIGETAVRRYRAKHWDGFDDRQALLGQALSTQQQQVLSRMFEHDEPTAARAAADLGLTTSGVEQRLMRAYRKLGVRTLLGAYRVLIVERGTTLEDWRRP